MKRHLSTEDLSGWVAGERAVEAVQHVRTCLECRAEIDRIQQTLAQFRGAVREWSDSQLAADVAVSPVLRPRRWGWAFAAAAVLLVAGLSAPFFTKQPADPTHPQSDADLLSSIRSQVSSTVPGPMEPLTRLIPSEVQQ